jgi:hypothetical protein
METAHSISPQTSAQLGRRQMQAQPLCPERISSMMFVGDTLYASVYQSQIGSALVKSSNYGNTWTPIPNNIPNGNSQLAGLAKHGGHWFIGAEVGGIYTFKMHVMELRNWLF